MQPARAAALQPNSAPAGMLLLVGVAVALLQLTSLMLGPASSRQFNLSLAVPAVEPDDISGLVVSQADSVLGAITRPAPSSSVQPASTSTPPASPASASAPLSVPAAALSRHEPAPVTAHVASAHRSGHDDRGVERRRGKAPARD